MTIILALCHGVIQASTTAHAVNQVASGLQVLYSQEASDGVGYLSKQCLPQIVLLKSLCLASEA
jgi:hypothetical protein